MSNYSHTQSRVFQWIGIILVMGVFAGAYWYYKVQGSTITQSQNGLLTQGLIGFWSFNANDISGSTAYDRSGSGYDGVITGGATGTDGEIDRALTFDGAGDYVDIPTVTLTGTFTYSFWYKTSNNAQSGHMLGGTGGSSYIKYGLISSNYFFRVLPDGSSDNTVAPASVDTWHHLVVTRDSSNKVDLYVDNGSANRLFSDVAQSGSANLSYIGSTDDGQYFNGQIDEVRIYNRTLTAEERYTLYNQRGVGKTNSSISQAQGSGRLDSGLAGYWKLDDGSGTSATDASTNGNAGTLTNGPTWTTGQIGGGLDFDGSDDYVEVAYSSSLVASQSLTYSFWVRPDLNEQAGLLGSLNGENGSGYNFITLDNNGAQSGNPEVYFTRSINGSSTSRTVSFPYTVSQWFHYTYTYDGAYERVYVNGNKLLETAQTGNFATNTEYGLVLGDPYQGAPGGYDGVMDEVRVYTRALSSDEVSQLYRLTTPTSVDTSLKGYWSFNGQDMSGTNAFDRSGAGNTGTLTNSPTKVTGRVGQALNFDGTDDYVTISDSNSLDLTVAHSISVWVKPDTITDGLIVSKGAYALNYASYALKIGANDGGGTSGKINYTIRSSNAAGNNTVTQLGSPTTGAWTHIVGTHDGTTMRLYINGVLDNTASGNVSAPYAITDVLQMGSDDNGGTRRYQFDGTIDEPRLYNRTLSAAEIKSLYDQGSADSMNSSASQLQGTGRLDSALAGYWALDNGSGVSATDQSTNAATGALTNGPTWTTGQIGGAVTFDNTDDYISIPDSDILDVGDTDDLTLMGWFNRTTTGSADAIIFKRAGTLAANTGYGVHLASSGNKLTFEVSDGTDEYSLESTSTFTSSGWNHFAVVWDQDSAANSEIYINGAANSATDTGTIGNIGSIANSTVLAIGAATDASLSFNGSLDELRVYRRTLTPDQIAEAYRLSMPTSTDIGLKGYWSFNGQDISGTTAYDRSGANNTGTLTLGPTPVIGKIGQALNLDGSDDYVVINDADSLDIGDTDDLTITGWFYRDTFTTDDVILSKRNTVVAGSAGYITYVEGTTDKIYFEVSDATDEYQLTSTTTFTTAGWNHFAIVWDQDSAANTEIYVNGVADSAADTGTIGSVGDLSNTRPVAMGVTGLATTPYDGRLDEMRVYKRALSAAEIAALYNQSR